MQRSVSSSAISAIAGKTVLFSFWFRPETVGSDGSQNQARAEIGYIVPTGGGGGGGGGGGCCPRPLGATATPSSWLTPSTTYSETSIVTGLWEGPTQLSWYVAKVAFTVPCNVVSMSVYIHGQPNFKAFIDSASFAITDSSSTSVTQGKFGLGMNLYEWRRVQGLTYVGHAALAPAIYVESNPGYFVLDMRITIELQPTSPAWDWWCFCYKTSTSRQGKITVLYVQQLNDQGFVVDPAAIEQANTNVLNAFVFVVDVAAGIGLSLIGPEGTAAGAIFGEVAGTVIGSTVVYLLTGSATSADDPNSNGGEDYSVTEYWNYNGSFKEYEVEKFVRSATGHYGTNWDFNTGSNTGFVIKITGTTTWSVTHTVCPNQGFCSTSLNSAGSSSLTTYLTVYA